MNWTLKSSRAKVPPPGEPLYTLEETADRLGLTLGGVKHLMTRHEGLRPWHTDDKCKNLYRLSDARRWHRAIKTRLQAAA